MKKIALISHGCAKNLVDSELILGFLKQAGYGITLNEDETDLVIVNTCSFICDAEKESVHSILEMVETGKKVIVTGCLSQKHANELKDAIPEICAVVGTTDFSKIAEVVEKVENGDYVEEVNKNPHSISNPKRVPKSEHISLLLLPDKQSIQKSHNLLSSILHQL